MFWTNVGILLIGPDGTNFSEIFSRNAYIFIQGNAFAIVVWKIAFSSGLIGFKLHQLLLGAIDFTSEIKSVPECWIQRRSNVDICTDAIAMNTLILYCY